MGKFRVGDIAVAVKPSNRPDLLGMNGREVTIIGPLRKRSMGPEFGVRWCYLTNYPGRPDYQLRALPEWLRRKEDKIDWKDCIFKPDECPVAVGADPK